MLQVGFYEPYTFKSKTFRRRCCRLPGHDVGPPDDVNPRKSAIGFRRGLAGPASTKDCNPDSFPHSFRPFQRIVDVARSGGLVVAQPPAYLAVR